MAEEVFHSVKSKKLSICALQLDLNKDYDKVSWGFLKLILIELGLPFMVMKWIMGCVTSVVKFLTIS